ncbi:3325_t:CDS:1, partial [Acaulospora colombiana]
MVEVSRLASIHWRNEDEKTRDEYKKIASRVDTKLCQLRKEQTQPPYRKFIHWQEKSNKESPTISEIEPIKSDTSCCENLILNLESEFGNSLYPEEFIGTEEQYLPINYNDFGNCEEPL